MYSHRAYAASLGSLDFPLLADFHPHGKVTKRYGLWRTDKGYGRRSVFVVDREGIIRWTKVYPSGAPDIDEIVAALPE
jgi:alkyl hydroperoxide reductase subunit AhpC